MKKSDKMLSYFQCKGCDKTWCVTDAPAEKTSWFCPWCGIGQTEEPESQPQDVPECKRVQDFNLYLDEAGKELKKLFGSFSDIFKKQK